jgi:hypothetical protein
MWLAPNMPESLSDRYAELLSGSYDCADRIVLNAYSGQQAIGRLFQVCERWIYSSCLCFALEFEEQKRSGFHYQYFNYQVE